MKLLLVILSVVGSVLSQSYGGTRLNPQNGAQIIANRFTGQGTQSGLQGTIYGLQTLPQNSGQGFQNPGQVQPNNGQGFQSPGQLQQNNGQGQSNPGQAQLNNGQGLQNPSQAQPNNGQFPINGQGSPNRQVVPNTGLGQHNEQRFQNEAPIQNYQDFGQDSDYNDQYF